MESGVRTVILGALGEVTHDIWVLTEYNGQGRCSQVILLDTTAARYRAEIRTWARSGHMRITEDSKSTISDSITIKSVDCNNSLHHL